MAIKRIRYSEEFTTEEKLDHLKRAAQQFLDAQEKEYNRPYWLQGDSEDKITKHYLTSKQALIRLIQEL